MTLIDASPVDIATMVGGGDIECECMLCHLPLGEPHGPVRWKLTFRFPGPYPEPGVATMLMCDPCYEDWVKHPEEFGGFPNGGHKV